MSDDISRILKGWKYKPGQLIVRKIKGDDGRDKLQVRLDLGLMQMEIEGRPDGKRPHGKKTVLDYYKGLLNVYQQTYSNDEGFKLTDKQCKELQDEALQFYHRYISLVHINDFARAARDTLRNLCVLDFIKKYAAEDVDVWLYEQYRPYLILMYTQSRCALYLNDNNFDEAIKCIDIGLRDLKAFMYTNDKFEVDKVLKELENLRVWATQVRDMSESTPVEKLEKRLEIAIKSEDYETAAKLRDEIIKLST